MVASHRETCYGPVLLVLIYAIVAFDVADHVLERHFEGAVHHSALLRRCLSETLGTFSRSCDFTCIAVGHHDDHRLCLALSYKVVEDLRCASEVHPCLFVAACSMQKIEYRIFLLLVLIVSGRGIDGHPSCQVEGRALVPYLRNRSVRYVVHLVVVSAAASDDEYVHRAGNIAVDIYVARIEDLEAIDNERIAVQLRSERLRGVFPDSVLLGHFCKCRNFLRINAFCRQEVSSHMHSDSFWSHQPECDAVVFINLR